MAESLDSLANRVVDSVRRIAVSLRSENERLKRRIDLLATQASADDLLDARLKRLEAKADDDAADTERFAVVLVCTPLYCAKAGIPCRTEFFVHGTDEYLQPFKRECTGVRDVLIEMRSHWPANVKIMADGNADPALKMLVSPRP